MWRSGRRFSSSRRERIWPAIWPRSSPGRALSSTLTSLFEVKVTRTSFAPGQASSMRFLRRAADHAVLAMILELTLAAGLDCASSSVPTISMPRDSLFACGRLHLVGAGFERSISVLLLSGFAGMIGNGLDWLTV